MTTADDSTPRGSVSVAAGNEDQAAAWNGDEGEGWSEYADHYDAAVEEHQSLLLAAAAIVDGESVLDVGCGNGASTIDAALATPRGRALGLDLSGPMLARARRRAAARGIGNVRFEEGDAQVYAFEPRAVDLVVSRLGVMFFADPVTAFDNLAGTLRPGGRLAVVAWRGLADNEWLVSLRSALAAGRELPDPPAGVPGPFGLADPDRAREILGGAGFADVDVAAVDPRFVAGADVEDAFAFVCSTGIARGLVADLDDAERAAAADSLRDDLAAHATDEGVIYGSAIWMITARVA